MMNDKKTQNQRILAHLRAGKTITPLEALKLYGCFRLGARVFQLRGLGHDIQKEMVDVGEGRRVAKYFLQKSA